MLADSASLLTVSSTAPLVQDSAANSPKKTRSLLSKLFKAVPSASSRRTEIVSPEDIFHQIMSINAASGSLEAKAFMHDPTLAPAARPARNAQAKKAPRKAARPAQSAQEIADEIMRLNALHGPPHVQSYAFGSGTK